jgi:hypothetical protein
MVTPPIGKFLNILESGHQKLPNAHGFTFVTTSLHRWKTFSTPGALTHIRITWALSLMAPHISGVTSWFPLYPWCCGHSSWRGARQIPSKNVAKINYKNESMLKLYKAFRHFVPSSTFGQSETGNSSM